MKISGTLAILLALLFFPLQASESSKDATATPLTAMQEQAVRALIRDELKQHPELVLEAVQQLEKNEQVADEADEAKRNTARLAILDQKRDALEHDANDGVIGNPNGNLTLVEFFDYRCPYCKEMADDLLAAVKTDGNVRLILKEYPVLGPQSLLASKAALAAKMQGKYTEFHTALMHMGGNFTVDNLSKLAISVGLNGKKLTQDMMSPEIAKKLGINLALGHELEFNQTPSLLIGRTAVTHGGLTEDYFKEWFTKARAVKDGQ